MEPHHHHHHKKQASNSSLTADLFGAPDSPQDPSKGIFASIFPPPSKVLGRNSASSELLGSWQKHAPGNQASPTNKHGSSTMGGESGRSLYRDRGSALQEQRAEPCHLSSSIYYGGRDVYSRSPNSHVAPHYPPVKKDSGEADLNGIDASRGNWWQGSLYY